MQLKISGLEHSIATYRTVIDNHRADANNTRLSDPAITVKHAVVQKMGLKKWQTLNQQKNERGKQKKGGSIIRDFDLNCGPILKL